MRPSSPLPSSPPEPRPLGPPPPSPTEPTSLEERLKAAPFTLGLFAVCVAVFVFAEREGSTKDIETLLTFGATERQLVWQGQWWRLVSSMFLHIGVVHLVWNLWMGYRISVPVERALGSWRFLLVYLLSGVVGSALSVIGHEAVTAGASGALFGMLGSMLVLVRVRLGSWAALWANAAMRANVLLLIIWIAIGPAMGFDSFAHAGGLLAGMALTWGLAPLSPLRLAVAVMGCAVVVGAALHPLPGINS